MELERSGGNCCVQYAIKMLCKLEIDGYMWWQQKSKKTKAMWLLQKLGALKCNSSGQRWVEKRRETWRKMVER